VNPAPAEPRAARAPRRARLVAGALLGTMLVFGFGGFEAWPLTSFHLFSAARKPAEYRWVATTVDAAGHETPLDQQHLTLGYRLAEWPLQEFPHSSPRTRQSVCDGIARGARSAGRQVVEVRVYKVWERLHDDHGHWRITTSPRLFASCDERGTA